MGSCAVGDPPRRPSSGPWKNRPNKDQKVNDKTFLTNRHEREQMASQVKTKAQSHTGELSFPLRHVSVRVPWHDSGWTGCVCKDPKFNTACLKLKGISEKKKETAEEDVKGDSIEELLARNIELPPCVSERATFMAAFDFARYRVHPYVENNPETHGHFLPTLLRHPAYSLAAIPFRWVMRDVAFGNPEREVTGLVETHPLDEVDQKFEPELPFETNWIQDHRNHRACSIASGIMSAQKSLLFSFTQSRFRLLKTPDGAS